MPSTITKFARDLGRFKREGMPKYVLWSINNHCNVVCTTCKFYLTPKKDWVDLEVDRAERALDMLHRSNFRYVSLTGGEPLLHPGFFDICEAVNRRGMELTYIPTNGTLVDDEVAARLKRVNPKVVGLSVEPIGEDGMGHTRKIKNFPEVLRRASQALHRAGVPTYAQPLLSRHTLDISECMEMVRDLGFTRISFSYPQVHEGPYIAARDIPELHLTLPEVEDMVRQIKAAKRNFPDIAIYNTDESLDDFLRFYRGEPARHPCLGGQRLFYMNHKLDIYRCFTLPTHYGNALEMERFDFEEPETCAACTQQAFRDVGPVYTGAQSAVDAIAQLGRGRPLQAFRAITDPHAVAGIRALVENFRGGFL